MKGSFILQDKFQATKKDDEVTFKINVELTQGKEYN